MTMPKTGIKMSVGNRIALFVSPEHELFELFTKSAWRLAFRKVDEEWKLLATACPITGKRKPGIGKGSIRANGYFEVKLAVSVVKNGDKIEPFMAWATKLFKQEGTNVWFDLPHT